VSAVKPVAAALTATGTGTWISLEGWPAAVAVGVGIAVVIATFCWVLNSEDRTARITKLIAAIRIRGASPTMLTPSPLEELAWPVADEVDALPRVSRQAGHQGPRSNV